MIVVDTGVLFAAADRSDADHPTCAALLEAYPATDLIVPAPVASETAWLVADRLGNAAEAGFIASLALGELTGADLDSVDYSRCAELLATYSDLRLGLADASVVSVAERRGIATLATLDRRDFTVVRPRHVAAFELLP